MSLIQIDGSYGEGGGQIIRTSLSLAALTGKPVELINIRARRTKPGLQPQHLTAVRAAASICAARLEGDAVGATRILFQPGAPPQPGRYFFAIGTAGASPLVAQTVLAPLAAGGDGSEPSSHVTVTGGTHVPHAPTAEYLEAVYLPALRRAGLDVTFQMNSAGFYPKGGGQIDLHVGAKQPLQPLELIERGKLKSLKAYVVTSLLPSHVAERGAAAIETFMKSLGRPVTVEHRDRPSNGPGAAVLLAAECEGGCAGFSSIGARGKPMEKVAEEACAQFIPWWKSGAACDEHLADQLVLPMAFASGESRWTTPVITEHLRTVLWVTQQFLPMRVTLDEGSDRVGTVTIQPSFDERIG